MDGKRIPATGREPMRMRQLSGNERAGTDNERRIYRKKYADVQIDYFQSNIEGELIDKIQQVGFDVDGIILNAGQQVCHPYRLHEQSLRTGEYSFYVW